MAWVSAKVASRTRRCGPAAVIGGLICATMATLVFVPVVFSIAHRKRIHAADDIDRERPTGDLVHAE